ncbi:hypothetical protein QFC24_006369 [Naganishia onofrii]|uniref:Uncharacterized protein n=1 Tax=Naganishia onofrii TaxID=1851511 RepID=A0ACC2X0R3_9TREE|nr:hypothetical protein QFC24_006369 [Naganishia onofrii]
MAHLYVLPRFAVISGYEHQAFIPYTDLFATPSTINLGTAGDLEEMNHLGASGLQRGARAQVLQCTVTDITKTHITYTTTSDNGLTGTHQLQYSYMVFAAGSRLPRPLIRLPANKSDASQWLGGVQATVAKSTKIMVVGGGPLGIQFASDIKAAYPTKEVTLVVSRSRLLPSFDEKMHLLISTQMESLGVNVIYNDRVSDIDAFEQERAKHIGRMMSVTLRSGRVVDSDLQILAIGQRPNHELLSSVEPTLLSSENSLKVLPTLQLDHPDWSHVFAIGDVAQTGAVKVGYMALAQADIASSNIVELVQCGGRGSERNLKSYEPAKPEIKVTVGLTTMVSQRIGGDGNYEWSTSETPKDLHTAFMWSAYGADPTDMTL